ncbi:MULTISPECIES: diaminopimelate epimerase [Methanothrix]|jgi:diaminopimelate epimerase|uniref:Diaminopimelate epimerase n=1 Tax=Methanothrix thermoacetophila (strain DSM 6194 / JCM 14653 / NBRC 101360 / PT) TaxID=349307 RepID=DAPF_METTP|nr:MULTISPECIES: diaminopimelate epimerase [Methanothrix]A0B6C1.1 RecName: Full=Diaminopimelate epimerase; Short=DAP epimerase; AltName: Full=PLP-independent amino acid racemase [Methanothrix thermoacetophila PT]ABK14245.1 diaminopimelate epimerase [Methanothrix thermoacetophila PT]NPU87729.1 diaminopimelate epimerase [Methanothrix sp.]
MNQLEFVKLHGNGNDFILIDELNGERIPEDEKSEASRILCHRNFGIGGDGVLFLVPSERADIGMRLFQPDGSEAEMCGNGIRCLAKHAWESGYVGERFSVETLAGVIPIQVRRDRKGFWARVEMGIPRFERSEIPADGEGTFLKVPLHGFEVSAVNTGVPHAVIFVENLDIPVEQIAPKIRHSSCFPEGANVNFVRLGNHLEVRTFERGVEAETLSCGTGSVAAAAVARRLGLVGETVEVMTKGGPLRISFAGEKAFMEGPAVTVCRGVVSDEILQTLQ